MNFDEAIRAHAVWKMKLSQYLDNPDGSLQADSVEVDNKCALGQWVHGEGAKFSPLPEYDKLKKAHAQFHIAAAEVVRKADKGLSTTEDIILGGQSDFAKSSMEVINAIMTMKTKAV